MAEIFKANPTEYKGANPGEETSDYRDRKALIKMAVAELTLEGKAKREDFRKSTLFNNSGLIEVISLKRPTNRGSDPISVKKLLQEAKKEYRFKDTDEFWLIIDRDDWEEIHNHNFDKLVDDCKKENNFFLAMSNPCFEIWLILHLKDINELDEEQK
jgi:hypothetical protein